MRKKKNIMYAVTGEGNLYTFALSASHALPKDFEVHRTRDLVKTAFTVRQNVKFEISVLQLESTGRLKDHSSARSRNIDYLTQQKIPPNIVMSVLADIGTWSLCSS